MTNKTEVAKRKLITNHRPTSAYAIAALYYPTFCFKVA